MIPMAGVSERDEVLSQRGTYLHPVATVEVVTAGSRACTVALNRWLLEATAEWAEVWFVRAIMQPNGSCTCLQQQHSSCWLFLQLLLCHHTGGSDDPAQR